MAPAADTTECVERLLRDFHTYDRAVDVASAFEMVYTASDSALHESVEHFERFPRIPVPGGDPDKSDFTVVFNDGTGLVGEIARLARRDESADSVCKQLGRYDALKQLPVGNKLVDVDQVDVVLLVPMDVGPAAARRIIRERYLNPEHWYEPTAPPTIVQFGFDEGRYLFQHFPDEHNGLPRDGERPDGLGNWFTTNGDFRAKPERFAAIKAARAFMNDPVDKLYLATQLWAKTFATAAGAAVGPLSAAAGGAGRVSGGTGGGSRLVRVNVDPVRVAAEFREQYGVVRRGDVERALKLLETAKLADRTGDGWVVAWQELRSGTERNLPRIIAQRACKPPSSPGALARLEAVERIQVTEVGPEQLW